MDNWSPETKVRIMKAALLLAACAGLVSVYFGHAWGFIPGAIGGYLSGTLRAIEVCDAVTAEAEKPQS